MTAQEGKVLARDLTHSLIKLLTAPPPPSPASFPFCLSCSLVTTPVSRRLISVVGCHLGCILSRNFWKQKSYQTHSRFSSGGISGTPASGWRRCFRALGVDGTLGAFPVPLDLNTQAAAHLQFTPQGSVRASVPAGGRQPGAARSAFQFKCPPGFAVSDRDRVSGS